MELAEGTRSVGKWRPSGSDAGSPARKTVIPIRTPGLAGWMQQRRRSWSVARQDDVRAMSEAAEVPRMQAEVAAMPRYPQPGGLAGWVLGMMERRKQPRAKKNLQVIETLSLGGRRQLLLVSCGGERFLVGSGADRVDTIVRVGDAAGNCTSEAPL